MRTKGMTAVFYRCIGRNCQSYRCIYFIAIGIILLLLTSSFAILASVTGVCLQDEFDAQVRQLIRNVTISEERLQSLPKILHAVEDTLNTVWPGCTASILGSLALGLGSSSSDADIAVSIPRGQYTTDSDVIHHALTAFQNSPHYQQINVIESKRISVINLYYKPSDILCDISFKTVVAPYETELLKYLLNADERVHKMAAIMKHWANIHNITVKNVQSSVCMLLLVIFFLQQRSILPPVIELQQNVRPNILNGSERFNVAFEKKRLVSVNDENLYEILGEFFVYYSNFDFDKYIVSTFLGEPLEKSAFEDLEIVPNVFFLYKINVENNITHPLDVSTALCIQPPLAHNNNCAVKVNRELRNRMELNFKKAAILYRNNDMASFLTDIYIIT